MGTKVHPGSPPSIVEDDLHCRRCGYNLRGLSSSGNCPECAFAVRLSSGRRLLSLSDGRWLRRMLIGAHVLLGTYCFAILGLPLVLATVRGFGAQRERVGAICIGATILLGCIGAILMASPDPSGTSGKIEERVRRRSRLWTSMFAVGTFALAAAGSLGGAKSLSLLNSLSASSVLGTSFAAVLSLHYHASWMALLAARSERGTLSALCVSTARGVLISGSSAVALAVAVVVYNGLNLFPMGSIPPAIAVIGGTMLAVASAAILALPVSMILLFASQLYISTFLAKECSAAAVHERDAKATERSNNDE